LWLHGAAVAAAPSCRPTNGASHGGYHQRDHIEVAIQAVLTQTLSLEKYLNVYSAATEPLPSL
jgi:hypothetical protein